MAGRALGRAAEPAPSSRPRARSILRTARLLRGRSTERAGSGVRAQPGRGGEAKRGRGHPGPSGHYWPGARRPRAPAAPHRAPRPSQAPDPRERRAARSASPSQLPRATATKWRTREKRPATSPSAQRPPSAHARAPAPSGRRGLPVTSRGAANRERGHAGRACAARARPRAPSQAAGGRCLEAAGAGRARRFQNPLWEQSGKRRLGSAGGAAPRKRSRC
uniref:Translation initiation factor IF-2-like n=1 Tax=Tursiops truncatus TaxID=9739 RepID=A0A6J3PUY6_TURTR|nr:translation initiation factor IF-2-like [Tursiops truncatus]